MRDCDIHPLETDDGTMDCPECGQETEWGIVSGHDFCCAYCGCTWEWPGQDYDAYDAWAEEQRRYQHAN